MANKVLAEVIGNNVKNLRSYLVGWDTAITAKPQTAVGILASCLTPIVQCTGDDVGENLTDSLFQSDDVGQELGEITSKASECIFNIIKVANMVVLPLCNNLLKLANDDIIQYRLKSQDLNYEIIPIDIPPLLMDKTFLDWLELHHDKNYFLTNAPAAVTLPSSVSRILDLFRSLTSQFAPEELAEVVQTGISTLDEKLKNYISDDIVSFLDNCGPGWITGEGEIDKQILVFFLLKGLVNEKSDKCTAALEDSYVGLLCNEVIRHCANNIYSKVDLLTTNKLMMPAVEVAGIFYTLLKINKTCFSGECKTIYVYRDAFMEWVKAEKGSSESLIGGHMYFRPAESLDSISFGQVENDKNKFEEIYTQRLRMAAIEDGIKDNATACNSIKQNLRQYIAESLEFDETHKQQCFGRIDSVFNDNRIRDNRIHSYVIKVVCGTLGINDETKEFIRGFSEVLEQDSRDNPDFNKALLMASIRLTAQWLAMQVDKRPGGLPTTY